MFLLRPERRAEYKDRGEALKRSIVEPGAVATYKPADSGAEPEGVKMDLQPPGRLCLICRVAKKDVWRSYLSLSSESEKKRPSVGCKMSSTLIIP